MYLSFMYSDLIIKTSQINKDKHSRLFNKLLPKNFYDNCALYQDTTCYVIIDNIDYMIRQKTWLGSVSCPISNVVDKDMKHQFRSGGCDWFVTKNNEMIWIPDLLPKQIGMWGFFQSQSSEYRLDPEKYIKFFNLNGLVKPLTIDKNKKMIDLELAIY